MKKVEDLTKSQKVDCLLRTALIYCEKIDSDSNIKLVVLEAVKSAVELLENEKF